MLEDSAGRVVGIEMKASATKEATERILNSLGLTPTEAIRLFYRQIAAVTSFQILILPRATSSPPMRSTTGISELMTQVGGPHVLPLPAFRPLFTVLGGDCSRCPLQACSNHHSRKAKAAQLLEVERLSLVAGRGFEPLTFRL